METLEWVLLAVIALLLIGWSITVMVQRHLRRANSAQLGPQVSIGSLRLGNELRVVLSRLDNAVVVLDDRDRVHGASPAAYGLRLIKDGSLDKGPIRLLTSDARYYNEERVAEVEWRIKELGQTKQLALRATPLGADHVLLQVTDQTEARRVEDIRRDFVANVSHELKTPVGAISLLAETIASATDDPAAVQRFAELLQAEAERLTTLVQEVIELSRVQQTATPVMERLVPVTLAVTEAIDHLQTTADSKKISLVYEQDSEVMVRGDLNQLVTVVRNVVHNAISYSEPHTTVTISVGEQLGYAVITVADQGIGIPSDLQTRVFERFYRVDPARSRETGGTGLGLSIVKNIVSEHHGLVEIWSQPKVGTTVTIRLPLPETEIEGNS